MNSILNNIYNSILQTTIWEWFAVASSVLYVILITYKVLAAWIFAALSSLLYIYLCYSNRLYLESILQVFYFAMAIYGWFMWTSDDETKDVTVIQWPLKYHLYNVLISGALMLLFGYIFDNYSNQANPYLDAFTTIFSLMATFMVAKKVLENWIYWIIIDAFSVYLFASRGLYMTSVLFILYTLIAVFGYFQWRKQYQLDSINLRSK
ncbi:MAG: nicotinamide riboside transporter PnuC [Crocinitomicaceae bacterium]|nr:MAG: nicotinamide riboside transporter PnuC [Crocinitomicaceae bacterium]